MRATIAWLTGASLLGLLLLWRSASDYVFTASRDTARFGANDIPGNQSIRGMLLRSDLPDGLVSPCWLVVSLVLLAVATYGAWRLERAGQRLAAVAVLACLSVAVSPISWVHHLIWLACRSEHWQPPVGGGSRQRGTSYCCPACPLWATLPAVPVMARRFLGSSSPTCRG
ncbi:MAG: glycosyltransferase 87 family protein [Mycobacteriales bacterium]